MPIYVLHDLYFEVDGCQAQIDFLVITNKLVFVIECKNLYGNIAVNEQGDFVRTLQFGKLYQKEGIYSPITQNEHHMEVLKKMRLSVKSNIVSKSLFIKYFDSNYRSLIVLANPKTYLNIRNAPEDIKNHIIRCDQLIRYIKNENKKSDRALSSDKEMKELAEFFARANKERTVDYIQKYQNLNKNIQKEEDTEERAAEQKNVKNETRSVADCELLRQKLIEYRLLKSREERIKPYYIYNNLQMEKIIELLPKTHQELMRVNGIAEKKCEKYGEDILNMIKMYARNH